MISTNVRIVRALLELASDDPMRYYLCGLYCDSVHGVIVATDGRALVVYKPKLSAICEASRIVPREALEAATKGAKPGDSVHIEADRITTTRGASARVVEYVPGEGRFPEWARILPRDCGAESRTCYDPALVMALQKVFDAVADGAPDNPAVILHNKVPNSAALVVSLSTDSTAFGVVMPFLTDVEGSSLFDAITGANGRPEEAA